MNRLLWEKPMAEVINETETSDVVIIGGGPAGLSAAITLRKNGVKQVIVIEREPAAGGIPRHCGDSPFGMREFKRVLTGSSYARKLVREAEKAGVDIRIGSNVVALDAGGRLKIASSQGIYELTGSRVVIATGVRESPRSSRFTSGSRPLGVMNTGALQSIVYLKNLIPFTRPVIVGTELVSFSAIQTCRKANIQPVAMLEEASRITTYGVCQWLPRILGIPIHYRTCITKILGRHRVEGVVVAGSDGLERRIECDGILFTGQFTPESSLARMAHIDIDPASGGPVVDQYGRCSNPIYFAAGNLLRPVETAGWSWQEGKLIGNIVTEDLVGRLPKSEKELAISLSGPIKFVVPQRIGLPLSNSGMQHLQLRFTRQCKGTLTARNGASINWSKQISALPERRILLPITSLAQENTDDPLEIKFCESESRQ
jgi:thioredoxin reductase